MSEISEVSPASSAFDDGSRPSAALGNGTMTPEVERAISKCNAVITAARDAIAAAAEIERLQQRVAELERGEYICSRRGTRKDADSSGVANEF